MKIKKIPFSKVKARPGGFTLLELLVVMAIIATMATLSVPIIIRSQHKALSMKASSQMKQFLKACDQFHADHGAPTNGMPIWGTTRWNVHVFTCSHRTDTTTDANYDSAAAEGGMAPFIRALHGGHASYAGALTDTRIKYLRITEVDDNYKGGLTIHSGTKVAQGFKDPWGNSYSFLINFYNNKLMRRTVWYMGDFSGKWVKFYNSPFLMYSSGPDGAWGGDDDIGSWQ